MNANNLSCKFQGYGYKRQCVRKFRTDHGALSQSWPISNQCQDLIQFSTTVHSISNPSFTWHWQLRTRVDKVCNFNKLSTIILHRKWQAKKRKWRRKTVII